MRKLILLVALATAFGVRAQAPLSYYVTYHTATLTAQTEAVTVQSKSGAKNIQFVGALVSCSTAPCTVTLSVNGAAATTTAITPGALNNAPPATAAGFYASNVGAGTTVYPYTLTVASAPSWIDLSKFLLTANSNSNLTLSYASMTGTVYTSIFHTEN